MLKEQENSGQVCELGEAPASFSSTSRSTYLTRYRLIYDIFIKAMECDQAQVFTFMASHTSGGIDFSDHVNITTKLSKSWHALSHYLAEGSGAGKFGSADSRAKALIESYMAVTGYHHELVRETANKMRNKVDATGKSLLENSLMLVSSDMGEGQSHERKIHVSMLGNAGGRFKTGQFINGNKNLGSLWYTILKGLGVEEDSFGNSEGLIPGLIA